MQERRVVNDSGLATFFGKVYATMGVGLLITAAVSYLLGSVFATDYGNFIVAHRFMFWIATFLPFILVLLMNSQRGRENAGYARLMFGLLAVTFGFTFGTLWLVYPAANMAIALVVTAVVFFSMTAVGRITKQNLSQAGRIAYGALFGVILLSVINWFMGSTGLAFLLSYAILIIFIVMTAADTQALKNIYMSAGGNGGYVVNTSSLAVQGALILYLDFINLFVVILQIFGVSDRN
ncbi:Bax inhibitor-1/YccA family protein [Lacticaseibacillus jixiensis]|uniref:Bax inhibitor-1/YccA family protein n=1 Tax=Lacticaseibacillus jixiensis TaxID=3231926 RepID=UPI0036F2BC80